MWKLTKLINQVESNELILFKQFNRISQINLNNSVESNLSIQLTLIDRSNSSKSAELVEKNLLKQRKSCCGSFAISC